MSINTMSLKKNPGVYFFLKSLSFNPLLYLSLQVIDHSCA